MLFVTKIHKKTHPYFIMKGDASVLTEEGVVRLKGPFAGITAAGTKRVIFTHEDTVWITVHATNETDLMRIEKEIIAKDFDEMDHVIDMQSFIKNSGVTP
jgi:molybdopterin-guanine dinucleotide biosynthesis protein A